MATTKAMYNNFEGHASKIVDCGSTIHQNITDAYKALAEVNNASGWQGELYDKLVQSFNDLQKTFNETIEGVQYKIPSTIRYAARSFSGFDTKEVNNSTAAADMVSTIDKSGLPGLIYTPENVDSLESKLLDYFDAAKEAVNKAKSVVDNDLSADWSGPEYDSVSAEIDAYAADTIKGLGELVTETSNTFKEIKSSYDTTSSNVKNSVQYNA